MMTEEAKQTLIYCALHRAFPSTPDGQTSTLFRAKHRKSGPRDSRHGISVPQGGGPEQLHGGLGQHYLHQRPRGGTDASARCTFLHSVTKRQQATPDLRKVVPGD